MKVILHDRYIDGQLEVSVIEGSDTVTIRSVPGLIQCSRSEWQKLCAAFNPPADNPMRDTQHE